VPLTFSASEVVSDTRAPSPGLTRTPLGAPATGGGAVLHCIGRRRADWPTITMATTYRSIATVRQATVQPDATLLTLRFDEMGALLIAEPGRAVNQWPELTDSRYCCTDVSDTR
jgi:hypothetical protein